jgi:hypothetical protein
MNGDEFDVRRHPESSPSSIKSRSIFNPPPSSSSQQELSQLLNSGDMPQHSDADVDLSLSDNVLTELLQSTHDGPSFGLNNAGEPPSLFRPPHAHIPRQPWPCLSADCLSY